MVGAWKEDGYILNQGQESGKSAIYIDKKRGALARLERINSLFFLFPFVLVERSLYFSLELKSRVPLLTKSSAPSYSLRISSLAARNLRPFPGAGLP